MKLFHFSKKKQVKPTYVGTTDEGLLSIPEVTPKKEISLRCSDPVLRKLWNIALDDIEKSHNTVTEFGTVYSAGGYGKSFHQLVFNRDNAYSGLLSLNLLYPNEMLEAYHAIRKVRDRLGWTCFHSNGFHLNGIDGVVDDDLPKLEFFKKYQKASAINKTDDVVWIWAAYDLLKKNPQFGEEEWKWLYETAKQNFVKFYDPFFDATDGLYFGAPTFIDVGGTGYPEGFAKSKETDSDKTKEKQRNRCVWVKAPSTNSLYFKALSVMAEVAEQFGLLEEAEAWKKKAEDLRVAMKELLRFSNGSFTYFRHRDGQLEPRRDTLGCALPVLCGVVDGEDAKNALSGYPVTAYGTPLLFPFYDRPDYYHNNSMWPFADTFFLLAYEKAFGVSTVDVNLQILKNAFRNGHFYEVRDVRTNVIKGSVAQLWTTAAFLNAMMRFENLTGQDGTFAVTMF